jgi:hypothetical protein
LNSFALAFLLIVLFKIGLYLVGASVKPELDEAKLSAVPEFMQHATRQTGNSLPYLRLAESSRPAAIGRRLEASGLWQSSIHHSPCCWLRNEKVITSPNKRHLKTRPHTEVESAS